MEKLYTHKEAAELLGVTPVKLSWLARLKKIRAVNFSAGKYPEYKYRMEDIERFNAGLPSLEPEMATQKIVPIPRRVELIDPSQPTAKRLMPEQIETANKLLGGR